MNRHFFPAVGGSVIHPRNEYAVNLTKFFGLNRTHDFPIALTFGLYDGNEIVFQSHRYRFLSSLINQLRLLWRYGVDLFNLDPWIEGMLKWYGKIYPAQRAKTAFSSVYDLFHSMNSLFDDMVGTTIGKYLTELGFGQRFNKELARIAMRCNYGQDLDIHAFVGAISLAGTQGGLWSVKDGNFRIAEEALKASEAVWERRQVTTIEEVTGGSASPSTFRLVSLDADGVSKEKVYDAVILAVPCTVEGCGGIQFKVEGMEKKLTQFPATYHRTVANFVKVSFLSACIL